MLRLFTIVSISLVIGLEAPCICFGQPFHGFRVFVYENTDNGFSNQLIFSADHSWGVARYRWSDNRQHIDRLRFIEERSFDDGRIGTQDRVHASLFEAIGEADQRCRWFLIGNDALSSLNTSAFPIYSSDGAQPLSNQMTFTRWLSKGGTTRRIAEKKEAINALFDAKGLDKDEVCNAVFDPATKSEIRVSLIWSVISHEISQILESSDPLELHYFNINGRVQPALVVSEATRKRLLDYLPIPQSAVYVYPRGEYWVEVIREEQRTMNIRRIRRSFTRTGTLDLIAVQNAITEVLAPPTGELRVEIETLGDAIGQRQIISLERPDRVANRVSIVSKWQSLAESHRMRLFWRMHATVASDAPQNWRIAVDVQIGHQSLGSHRVRILAPISEFYGAFTSNSVVASEEEETAATYTVSIPTLESRDGTGGPTLPPQSQRSSIRSNLAEIQHVLFQTVLSVLTDDRRA